MAEGCAGPPPHWQADPPAPSGGSRQAGGHRTHALPEIHHQRQIHRCPSVLDSRFRGVILKKVCVKVITVSFLLTAAHPIAHPRADSKSYAHYKFQPRLLLGRSPLEISARTQPHINSGDDGFPGGALQSHRRRHGGVSHRRRSCQPGVQHRHPHRYQVRPPPQVKAGNQPSTPKIIGKRSQHRV
jgi:hypothetical protein